MPTDTDTEPASNATNRGRYRFIQYDDDGTTVCIVQDAENHRAWLQSTHTVAVER
ncbi:hypothetical protein SAMN04487947_0079 [Halogeometricum rufum]|uniref:Uncharacterized protein n=1 Tax=Halogeometricum rufum TaxID=553469 RepID=A0A1I6FVH8_9EURY|nr:hypothetical protein [Halogeometricum rufum]SFR33908.1 hypothetical protein SAMN04487947_0079 [Halogeometricum rufum]